jgi:uncharacterized protein YgiM (DUF1202 family)
MKKIMILLCVLFIGISIGIIVKDILQTNHYKKVESYEVIGKIKITTNFINVREQPSTKTSKIFEVVKGEKYDYIEMFTEERGVYSWYKIVFSDRRVGWVASYGEEPWIEEVE